MANRGRPKSANPKDTMIRVRMDRETVSMMDACAKELNTTRSGIVRDGIRRIFQEIQTK